MNHEWLIVSYDHGYDRFTASVWLYSVTIKGVHQLAWSDLQPVDSLQQIADWRNRNTGLYMSLTRSMNIFQDWSDPQLLGIHYLVVQSDDI